MSLSKSITKFALRVEPCFVVTQDSYHCVYLFEIQRRISDFWFYSFFCWFCFLGRGKMSRRTRPTGCQSETKVVHYWSKTPGCSCFLEYMFLPWLKVRVLWYVLSWVGRLPHAMRMQQIWNSSWLFGIGCWPTHTHSSHRAWAVVRYLGKDCRNEHSDKTNTYKELIIIGPCP